MTDVVEIFPGGRPDLFPIADIIAADNPAIQGVRASATIIFARLNSVNSVPAPLGHAVEEQG